MLRNLTVGAAVAAMLAGLSISAARAESRQPVNIPAGELRQALLEVSEQFGADLVFSPDQVQGLTTSGVHGELTTEQAVSKLLEGTDLELRIDSSGAMLIAPHTKKSELPRASTNADSSNSWSRLRLSQADAAAAEVASTNDSSAPGAGQLKLEEVVVSARRRDEALTSVPASITAYTSEFLQRQNIQSFTDYATKIPNLSFQYGQGGSFLWLGDRQTAIRGVVGNDTTAYYINDTPVPSSVSPLTLDLDRIEVLKGPQGTLFGSSSMGGNLRFITKTPSFDETAGSVQLEGGRTQDGGADFNSSAQANFALAPDRLGLDVAFEYARESGYTKRRFRDEVTGEFITKDDQGRTDIYSGAATLRAKLSDSLEATFNVIGQSTKLHGFPGAYVPFPSYRPSSYTSDRDADVQETSRDRWSIGSFVLNYAGTGISVVSSTSYFARRIEQLDDGTEGTTQYFRNFFDIDLGDAVIFTPTSSKEELFTHETRLSFDAGTLLPRLSGIVGVFYQHTDGHSRSPGVVIPEMVDAGLDPPYLGDITGASHENQTALFSEIYYEVVPKLTLTLGLRQYWIRQQTEATTNTGFVITDGREELPERNNKESGHVPKVVVSYEIGDQGTIYAGVSKGFRVGGYQEPLPDTCNPDLAPLGITPDEVRDYKSDTLWSYEVGAKSRLGNGRLNAAVAAFQLDWSDIQQSAFLITCGLGFQTNAGKARVRGGEVEIGGQLFESVPFSLQFGVGYTDAVLLDPGVLSRPANSHLNLVPQWTGSVSGYYETPLSEKLSLFAAADYSYTDSVPVDDGLGGTVTRQSINIINGNIGLSFGRSQISLYGKNLLDKRLNFGDQISTGFERMTDDGRRMPRGMVSRPRQLGLQYQMNF